MRGSAKSGINPPLIFSPDQPQTLWLQLGAVCAWLGIFFVHGCSSWTPCSVTGLCRQTTMLSCRCTPTLPWWQARDLFLFFFFLLYFFIFLFFSRVKHQASTIHKQLGSRECQDTASNSPQFYSCRATPAAGPVSSNPHAANACCVNPSLPAKGFDVGCVLLSGHCS